jgi:hypothetical protein
MYDGLKFGMIQTKLLRAVRLAVILKVLYFILNFMRGSGLTILVNVGILILLAVFGYMYLIFVDTHSK